MYTAGGSDDSGWTLPDTSFGQKQSAAERVDRGTETMEERLDPLQLAFSTPIAASQAGSVAIPSFPPHEMEAPRQNLFLGLPPSGKTLKRVQGVDESRSSKGNEVEQLRLDIVERNAELAEMSMQSSLFATAGAHSNAWSPHASCFNEAPGTQILRSSRKSKYSHCGPDASGWTLPGARTPGTSTIVKKTSSPSDKDAEIQTLHQVCVWHDRYENVQMYHGRITRFFHSVLRRCFRREMRRFPDYVMPSMISRCLWIELFLNCKQIFKNPRRQARHFKRSCRCYLPGMQIPTFIERHFV